MKKRTLITLIAAMALIFTISCGDDPATPDKEEDGIDWPDMTSRDDVIKTVVLTYEHPNDAESDSKYNALLHSLYFFMLHENDVNPGESQIMTRAEDLLSTEWIFTASLLLELTITETGAWDAIVEVEGEACTDCWETTRSYFVRVQFEDEGTIYQSPPESAFVRIVVAPDESDGSKWALRAMFDLGI